MKLGIIGGGPAGLMAAMYAIKNNVEVIIFEKNEKLGKKLYLTGKGRCNITNDCEDEVFFENIVNNSSFMYSAYYFLPPFFLMELLEQGGLPIKVERGNRVFPQSDKSSDVIKFFENKLKNKIKIYYHTNILNINKYKNKFYLKTNQGTFEVDKLIIATGGKTYSSTGSTGDGYIFAKNMGHTIIEPIAGLVGLKCDMSGLENLQGLSLRNVNLKAEYENGIKEIFGELVFTHYGISGPIVLSLSSFINRKQSISLSIDLKPALDEKKLDNRILREIDSMKNKDGKYIVKSLVPSTLVYPLLKLSNIPENLKGNQWTKEDRHRLTQTLKNFPLKYGGLFNENTGIITSGGVKVSEINPSTMESKLVSGLYFAGEVIDVDALTGGYNLHIAFSTGALAGESASKSL